MAERLNAPVLKTGRPKGLVSSNLTPSATIDYQALTTTDVLRIKPFHKAIRDAIMALTVLHTAENSKAKPVIGRPFRTGDRRVNRRGRPRNFDALRELCQKVCHEKITLDGEVMTRLEVILRDWSASKDVQKQIALVQYGYGKPVDKIETNGLENKTLILHYGHERPSVDRRAF